MYRAMLKTVIVALRLTVCLYLQVVCFLCAQFYRVMLAMISSFPSESKTSRQCHAFLKCMQILVSCIFFMEPPEVSAQHTFQESLTYFSSKLRRTLVAGKTLAFGMPALRHIIEQREKRVVTGKGPFMLCMAPTRELACQISDVLADAGSTCGISAITIYGGVPKRDQVMALRKGTEIAVGTPGRVCDLLQEGSLNLKVCLLKH